jgi:hypothetical protein
MGKKKKKESNEQKYPFDEIQLGTGDKKNPIGTRI